MINRQESPIRDEYIEKCFAEKELDLTATPDVETAYPRGGLYRDRCADELRPGEELLRHLDGGECDRDDDEDEQR